MVTAPTVPAEWRRRQAEQALAYHFLGRCFHETPRAEWLAALAEDRLFEAWPFPSRDDRTAAGLALLTAFCAGWNPARLGALEWDFNRLFVGPGEMLAPPWESVHRSKTKLTFQEPTLQVRELYRRFGVEAPALHREPDDHLGLELAFVATLSDEAAAAAARATRRRSRSASTPSGSSCKATCSRGPPPASGSSRSTPRPTTTVARPASLSARSPSRRASAVPARGAASARPADAFARVALSSRFASERLFTSARERRLWAWTAAVVAAIYSTLGLARTLAAALADSGLGAGFFILCCLLVLAAVVTQGLRARPGGAEIGVALGVAAAYILVFVRMSIPTERSHLIEYGVVALFVHEALTERASHGRRVPVPALLAVVAAGLVGALDECIQLLLPSRVFDPVDMLFNILAATMAVTASSALRWARSRRPDSRSTGG